MTTQVSDPLEEIHKMAYADESVLPPPKIVKTAEEWEKILPKEAFYVCRKSDTENPFTGKFDKHYEKGVYRCTGCNEPLFQSDTKFNSGTGWPSFFAPITPNSVVYIKEGNARYYYEVKCATCYCHLGHVFKDGPREKTGLRFCINSVCLHFTKE